jgi:hypothetical protein
MLGQGDTEMGEGDGEEDVALEELDEQIVEVYKGVGKLLTRYKSGKLPKALKMVPSLSNWQQVPHQLTVHPAPCILNPNPTRDTQILTLTRQDTPRFSP